MRIELEDEYYDLTEALESLLDKQLVAHPPNGSSTAGRRIETWKQIAQLGVLGLTVPEMLGGAGQGAVASVLPIEVLGAHAYPLPAAETMAVVSPTLGEVDAEWARELLSSIVRGDLVATAQMGWQGVAAGADCASVALTITSPDAIAVGTIEPNVELTSIDPQRILGRTSPDSAGFKYEAPGVGRRARSRWLVSDALFLLGLSRSVVARSVSYAMNREQFGRPIGSFQAIKHLLADAHVAVETTRRLCWVVAHELDTPGHGTAGDAAMVKALAAEAAERASYAALQTHGAIGYTWELDLHLWLKRIQVLSASSGPVNGLWAEFEESVERYGSGGLGE